MKKDDKPIITVPRGLPQLLLKKYPDLTPTEVKVCALLSFNLTSKMVAEITDRKIRTIEYTRNNIRKKMNLKHEECLVNHLILITNES